MSGVRSRPDRRTAQWRRGFLRWITGTRELAAVAGELRVSRRTLTRRFARFLTEQSPPPAHTAADTVLILDATWLGGRSAVACIARAPRWVRSWMFAASESYATWDAFVVTLRPPRAVVIDGNGGLYAAVRLHFPDALVQRCLAHVVRSSLAQLTRRPKTAAGQEIRALVLRLSSVWTRRQKRRWIRAFRAWERRHHAFLCERTYYERGGRIRWWYTHRALRAVRSHIRNALPHLFTYVRHPWVPRTSNRLEGGTNARIEELVMRHRGMPLARRMALVAYFLGSKAERKPPRGDA